MMMMMTIVCDDDDIVHAWHARARTPAFLVALDLDGEGPSLLPQQKNMQHDTHLTSPACTPHCLHTCTAACIPAALHTHTAWHGVTDTSTTPPPNYHHTHTYHIHNAFHHHHIFPSIRHAWGMTVGTDGISQDLTPLPPHPPLGITSPPLTEK